MTPLTPTQRNPRRRDQVADRPWRRLTPARIRAARTHYGMTQAEFALEIGRVEGRGLSPDWTKVSRWERGVRNPGTLWGVAILTLVERAERQMARGEERTGAGPAELAPHPEGH
jgi:DNA-binding transcriptional regulator YiaG